MGGKAVIESCLMKKEGYILQQNLNQKENVQMSDSRRLALVLAVSGGLMDAYTYLFRGRVFANAQTGNILLLGVNLSEGKLPEALRYLFPVLAFACGIVLAELIRHFYGKNNSFHWRQAALLTECVILFLVGFLSPEYNAAANAMVSFACGIQVESFRKVKGNASSTTMCIGNLRSGTQAVCEYFFTGEKGVLRRGLTYYGIILAFTIGAIAGNETIKLFGQRAIWCSCLFLVVGCVLMFCRKKGI